MSNFLRNGEKIERHLNRMPHWQQEGAMQFVTFRLGDAMPSEKLRIWKQERYEWMRWNPKPWSAGQRVEFERLFYAKLEGW